MRGRDYYNLQSPCEITDMHRDHKSMAANIINRDTAHYGPGSPGRILVMKYSSQKNKKIKPESDRASRVQFIGNTEDSRT